MIGSPEQSQSLMKMAFDLGTVYAELVLGGVLTVQCTLTLLVPPFCPPPPPPHRFSRSKDIIFSVSQSLTMTILLCGVAALGGGKR